MVPRRTADPHTWSPHSQVQWDSGEIMHAWAFPTWFIELLVVFTGVS